MPGIDIEAAFAHAVTNAGGATLLDEGVKPLLPQAMHWITTFLCKQRLVHARLIPRHTLLFIKKNAILFKEDVRDYCATSKPFPLTFRVTQDHLLYIYPHVCRQTWVDGSCPYPSPPSAASLSSTTKRLLILSLLFQWTRWNANLSVQSADCEHSIQLLALDNWL